MYIYGFNVRLPFFDLNYVRVRSNRRNRVKTFSDGQRICKIEPIQRQSNSCTYHLPLRCGSNSAPKFATNVSVRLHLRIFGNGQM